MAFLNCNLCRAGITGRHWICMRLVNCLNFLSQIYVDWPVTGQSNNTILRTGTTYLWCWFFARLKLCAPSMLLLVITVSNIEGAQNPFDSAWKAHFVPEQFSGREMYANENIFSLILPCFTVWLKTVPMHLMGFGNFLLVDNNQAMLDCNFMLTKISVSFDKDPIIFFCILLATRINQSWFDAIFPLQVPR